MPTWGIVLSVLAAFAAGCYCGAVSGLWLARLMIEDTYERLKDVDHDIQKILDQKIPGNWGFPGVPDRVESG